jgi:tRNA(adenine34) deaminase
MREALALAKRGLAENEVPIGAVITLGERVVAGAFWRFGGSLLDHAEVVALRAAENDPDVCRRRHEATLYTTLEPCALCMGAAMSFFCSRVVYALESPSDGAAELPEVWSPDRGHPKPGAPPYAVPAVEGGVCRDESLALVRAYVQRNPDVTWATTLLPD